MIKRGSLFLLVLVILIYQVSANAVGVSPAFYDVDFTPGLKQVFHFDFMSDDPSVSFKIYAEGDLADYVELSTDHLDGPGGVNALLELPEQIKKPGRHELFIGALQGGSGETGLGIIANIRGVIRVKVPYPGKYAEADFKTENANAGDPVKFSLSIDNLGKETITTNSYIEIYDLRGNKIDTLSLGNNVIDPTQKVELKKELDTVDYRPGDYKAIAIVEYGVEPIKIEKTFRLGELYVSVINTSDYFIRDKINKIDIDVESFWNDPISNLFAEVTILGYDITFLTPSAEISGFGTETLTGYFDTTGIKENEFRAKIVLHYKDKTTEKIVNLRFKRETDYLLISLIIIIAIIVAVLIYIIVAIRRIRDGKAKKKTK